MTAPARLPIQRFGARTLPALLMATAARGRHRVFLRFLDPARPSRPKIWTYGAFAGATGKAARFLREAGVGAGDRVMLLGENSPEWQMVALGAQLLRAEPAALFASLGAGPVQSIAERVRPKAIFVSTQAQWDKLSRVAGALVTEGLGAVLAGERLDAATVPAGLRVALAAEVTGPGAAPLPHEELQGLARAVTEEDPFLLLFTSGTTGRQKGVRLPQRAIVHAIDAGQIATGATEHDVGLHLLPFAHVAGQDQFALAVAQGHELIMMARRDELEAALALGPTYLFSVPMVYERIREGVEKKIAAMARPLRALVRASLAAAAAVRVDGARSIWSLFLARIAAALVGRTVRRRLGGRVRGVFSGGAPASKELFRFFEGLGLPFVELYGMSETAGMISSNLFTGPRLPGSVGWISPDHEVRIAEDGELLLRGPLMLSGYLEAEDTREAFTEDGFFRTGDLARVQADGSLRIEGRKKHLLVLSTGKKVSPEPIEHALSASAPFTGAVLLGEHRSFVSAIVFVDRDDVKRLEQAGVDAEKALLPRAHALLKDVSEYERPKRLLVVPGTPTDYPDLVTPTLKLKREAVMAWLGGGIAELYARA